MNKLIIAGNYCKIYPFTKEIAELCTNIRRRHDRQTRQNIETVEPLYKNIQTSQIHTGVTFTGLLPRLKKYYKLKNMKVQIEDRRGSPPKVDFKRIKGKLRFAQPEAIAIVTSTYSGQIKLPTANGKTQIIGLLTELYRDISKVLIISEKSSVLNTLLDRVKSLSSGYGYILNKDTDMYPKSDYIVCSTKSLHKVFADWPDIILYDEVHSAGAEVISQGLSKFTDTRMFGFTATPKGRSDNSELVIEALFGPVTFDVSYKQSQDAGVICPIKVFMVPVMGGSGDACNKKTDIARDRQGIWRNRIRNGVIRDVINTVPESEQVLIITNTTEHVFRLRRHLPDFVPVHGGMTDKRWAQFEKWKLVEPHEKDTLQNPDVNKIEEQFHNKEIRGAISTNVWREGVDIEDLVVLCRADGKRGAIPSIQIGGRLSRKGTEGQKNLGILIDFYDEFGKVFEGRTKDRIRFYRKEGWEVIEEWPDFNKLLTEVYT